MQRTSKPKSKTPGFSDAILKPMAAIVKEIGIAGFIVVFLGGFLVAYATKEQKQRFIDKWILLESGDHVPCVLALIFLTSIAVIGGIYLKTMLRAAKEENLRIGQEKSDLQEKLLKSRLSSSKKNAKL